MNDEERIRYDTILHVIAAELNPVLIAGEMNSCDEDEVKKVKSVVFRYELKIFRCEVNFLFCHAKDLEGELKKLYKELRPRHISIGQTPAVAGTTFKLGCFPYKVFVFINTDYPIEIGTVSHECLHAIHYVMQICGIPVNRHNDETEAYMLCDLVDEVFTHVRPKKG